MQSKTKASTEAFDTAVSQGTLTRRDWWLAFLLGALSLALYARTACPSIFVGDCAEIAGAAATFGVPHPPGYPLFTLLTGCLLRCAPSFDPATLANLVVGMYGALAVTLLTLLVRRLGLSRSAASFAALSLATGRTFWSQCVAAEVYSFDVLLFFASLHGLLSLARAPARRRAWFAAGILLGLWLGHRALNLVFIPSVLGFTLALMRPGSFKEHRRQIGWAVFGALLGGTLPILYLLIASRAQPHIDIGDPETLPRLWTVIRGAPYARHLGDTSFTRVVHRLSGFLWGSLNATELSAGFFAALFVIGRALRGPSAARALVLALTSLLVLDLVFASRYAVLDVEVFFLPAWATCAVLAAFGWDELIGRTRLTARPIANMLLASAAGVIALLLNFEHNDLSQHKITRVFAESIFESLPPDSIIIVNGDTSIHSMWYLQGVEHKRPDVTVVSLGHIVPWHLEQLSTRHPDVNWPPFTEQLAPREYVRALLLANIESRPVCFSTAINTADLLRADGSRAFELFTRGIVRQVYFTGQSLDLKVLVTWNIEFFERASDRIGAIPRVLDMDSRSTLLQYSLSMYLTARRARQRGWDELERKALEASLFCKPDIQERAIHDDVMNGLGLDTPLNQFGAETQKRLSELPRVPLSEEHSKVSD